MPHLTGPVGMPDARCAYRGSSFCPDRRGAPPGFYVLLSLQDAGLRRFPQVCAMKSRSFIIDGLPTNCNRPSPGMEESPPAVREYVTSFPTHFARVHGVAYLMVQPYGLARFGSTSSPLSAASRALST